MNDIKIEKGVPIPALERPRVRASRGTKYPWDQLEIGDSFEFDGFLKHARTLASRRKRKDSRNYAVRRDPMSGVVRIWRVEPDFDPPVTDQS